MGFSVLSALKRRFSAFYARPAESDSLKEGRQILHFNELPRCAQNFETHCVKENTSLIVECFTFEILNTKFSFIGKIICQLRKKTHVVMKRGCSGEVCLTA